MSPEPEEAVAPLVELTEADGILLSAVVKVQCTEPIGDGDDVCGQVIEETLVVTDHNPDEAPEMVVRCPACSERTGEEVLIPVLFLVGFAVADTLKDEEEPREVIVIGDEAPVSETPSVAEVG